MPDQRIQYTEKMTGAGHPTCGDTLNRLALIDHKNDGSHRDANFRGTTNTFVGNSTGTANTTGGLNIFIGVNAGQSNTTGANNVHIGYDAGKSGTVGKFNTTLGYSSGLSMGGQYNTFVGANAGRFTGLNGTRNVAIGADTLYAGDGGDYGVYIGDRTGYNTTGIGRNVFVGGESGFTNTTGNDNLFNGWRSGYTNTTGTCNVLIGNEAGYTQGTVSGNTFVGFSAGRANTGSPNTFIGYLAGRKNTSGVRNTFIGNQAGYSNTTGIENTFLGHSSGYNNTTGTCNVLIGNEAGYTQGTTASDNVFVGFHAGRANTTSGNTFLGANAGRKNTNGKENVFVGYKAGYANTVGSKNTFIGVNAGRQNTTGHQNVFIGESCGFSNTTGLSNVFIGQESGYLNTTGRDDTFVGDGAGYSNSTGRENTFIGNLAGNANTVGSKNTFIGRDSGRSNTIGVENTFLGHSSGYTNTTGTCNVLIGNEAGYTQGTVSGNTFVGFSAGRANTGSPNTFIGYLAGRKNTSGVRNTFIGNQAGYNNITGYENVFIGGFSGTRNTTGFGNIYIGYGAGAKETGNNKLYIENSSSTTPLIYGEFNNDLLRINNNLTVQGTFTVKGTTNLQTLIVNILKDSHTWLSLENRKKIFAMRFNNGGGFGAGAGYLDKQIMSTRYFGTFVMETQLDPACKGFIGAGFDGRYLYFVPNNNGAFHGRVARYDTTQDFNTASSWGTFVMETQLDPACKGFQGAGFDGRYLYFVPYNNGVSFGRVARYDTTQDFNTVASWGTFVMETQLDPACKGFIGAGFDGRYLYFVPNNNGVSFGRVARYDTTQDFNTASSWGTFVMETQLDPACKGFIGAGFDGRYLYFVPNDNGISFGRVARYDTTQDFNTVASWGTFVMETQLDPACKGFNGAAFDGRYLYFVPYNNGALHGRVARYDTTQDFNTVASWGTFVMETQLDPACKGFIGAGFDGRYLYFVPYNNGARHGRVARYESLSGRWW